MDSEVLPQRDAPPEGSGQQCLQQQEKSVSCIRPGAEAPPAPFQHTLVDKHTDLLKDQVY